MRNMHRKSAGSIFFALLIVVEFFNMNPYRVSCENVGTDEVSTVWAIPALERKIGSDAWCANRYGFGWQDIRFTEIR